MNIIKKILLGICGAIAFFTGVFFIYYGYNASLLGPIISGIAIVYTTIYAFEEE